MKSLSKQQGEASTASPKGETLPTSLNLNLNLKLSLSKPQTRTDSQAIGQPGE